MHFHDPERTKLANWRPCWLESLIALPPFQLEPHQTDPNLVTITICHGARGVWLSKDIPLTLLLSVFHSWSEDPEGTFMTLFGLDSWPKKQESMPRTTTVTRTAIPVEDLL